MIANILAPVAEKTLQAIAARLRRSVPGIANHQAVLRKLLHSGELKEQSIDGLTYVWPASKRVHEEPPRRVRFLAPFDPLVWDRKRFEVLWQWPYRFEAYTPPARRIRGYYAMPLLWGERVIRSVANLTRRDGEEFFALAEKIPVETEAHPYALERAQEALDDLRAGRFTGAAVIVPS